MYWTTRLGVALGPGTRYTTLYRGPSEPLGLAVRVGSGDWPNICAKKPLAFGSVPGAVPGVSPSPLIVSARSSPGPEMDALAGPFAEASVGSASATSAAATRYLRMAVPFVECACHTPLARRAFPVK